MWLVMITVLKSKCRPVDFCAGIDPLQNVLKSHDALVLFGRHAHLRSEQFDETSGAQSNLLTDFFDAH